jgi:hypothetical protein
MTTKETLRQRLAIIKREGITCGLDGCPVGGWAETAQAISRLQDDLPGRWGRSYTVHQLIDAVYVVDGAGRYRIRAEVSA